MIIDYLLSPYVLALIPLIYFVLPWVQNQAIISIPGPFLARFTNLWLMWQCRQGKRYRSVDEAHKKYGKLVRLQPNHVSIADDEAIQAVYGHGNGFLKAEFYDAFVSIKRGLFNTRDRAEHTRKRKIISHTFSAKAIGQFEPYMRQSLELFVRRWDDLTESKTAKDGYVEMNALHWFNYLAFDIIGDLAFGAPFGMLEKGKDVAEVRESPDAPPRSAPAIQVLNRRGEVSATLGCMPWLKPYAKHLPDPFFSKGIEAVQNLAGIAIARVKQRMANPPEIERQDLLAYLMRGKDVEGEPMGREELTAEALTQLIAGSDTTSNTSCAVLFHCLDTPHVVPKLQKELESVLTHRGVPDLSQVKDLPYLDAVIKETMRIHSTSSLGLPRVVTGEGITLLGHFFPPGTVLSVPSYTVHHSKEIWGEDADEFRPERWSSLTERQRNAFIPFSTGPRACVGRNVAEMELALIVSTVIHNFDFDLRQTVLKTREGFLRKPTGLRVGMRQRPMSCNT